MGHTLASAGLYDDTIHLWDASTGRHLRTLTKHISVVSSVAFSPDEQTIAAASFQEICLWDVSTGRYLRTLTGHTKDVLSVAFSPDGFTIASAGGFG